MPRLTRCLPEPGPDGQPIFQTSDDLLSFREMLGIDEGWKLEAFHNHGHFSPRNGEEACLLSQYRDAREEEVILKDRFPIRRFVVVIDPLDTTTVYQVAENAPSEDDGHWESNGPLSGVVLQRMLKKPGADPVKVRAEIFELFRERNCEGCKARWRCESDYQRGEFPGTRWADCPSCGLPNVVAVRTLRRTF